VTDRKHSNWRLRLSNDGHESYIDNFRKLKAEGATLRAKLRDTEIYFDIEGAGLVPDGKRMVEKPVMFAVHGGPGGDHTSYKPALTPLADKVQIVYFDHRGQGRSARGPKEHYTLDNNVDDMEALRQYLGLDKIVVLGTSYGGMVAMTYAARYPKSVSHLILVATASNSKFLQSAQQLIEERGNQDQKDMAQVLFDAAFRDEEHMKEYFRVMGPLYSLKFDARLVEDRLARGIYSTDAINMGFGTFLKKFNASADLHKILAPTLVLAGKHDWICPPELSQEFAKLIPNCDLRIFENSSHSIAGDETQAYIDAIRGFLTYKN
jgi:proline iminopeptidase